MANRGARSETSPKAEEGGLDPRGKGANRLTTLQVDSKYRARNFTKRALLITHVTEGHTGGRHYFAQRSPRPSTPDFSISLIRSEE